MRKLYFLSLTLFLFFAGNINAQTISTTTYPFTTSSGVSLGSVTGSTSLIGINSDDGASAVTNIGFDFWFVGTRYTQFSVNANGLLRLGGTVVSGAFTNSLTTATDVPQIAPYWDDLATGTTGAVSYVLSGTAPNRQLTVQWFVTVPRVTTNAANATFQCVLSETSGKIEFIYGTGMVANATNAGASIGFGSSGTVFSSVTLNATSTSSTCAYGTANNANTIAITSGTKFTFTPPTPTAPSGLNFTSVSSSAMTLNWTDNATNETGYVLYLSTDGTNYNFYGTLAANSITYTAPGLTSGTTYYWKVYANTEGSLSGAASGSQATTTATCGSFATNTFSGTIVNGSVVSLNTGGNWSLGHQPTECEDAVINVAGGTTGSYFLYLTTGPMTCHNLTITWTGSGNSTARNLFVFNQNFPLTATGNLTMSNVSTGNGPHVLYVVTGNAAIQVNGTSTIGGAAETKQSSIGGGTNDGNGAWVFKGNVTYGAAGSINYTRPFVFDANGAQTLTNNTAFTAGATDYGSFTVGQSNNTTLTLAGTAVTINRVNSLASAGTGGGNVTVNTGSVLVMPSTYTLNQVASATGTLSLLGTGTLKLAGTTGGQTGSNFPFDFASVTLANTSTVEYNGAAQTIYVTPTYGNLTLSTSGIKSATTSSLTVAGNLLINSLSTFAAGTSLTHNIGGNWTNNGTFTTTTGTINFNGSASATISGSAVSAFNTIVVNKGTSTATTLEANGAGALSNTANLTLTNGLFKITTGTFQFNAAPTIPATAGVHVNGGTLGGSGSFSYINNGLIRVSAGTFNAGTASGNSLTNNLTLDLPSGNTGTMNVAGRLLNTGTVTMAGGTIKLPTVGLSNGTNAAYEMQAAANLTMTGGTVELQNANTNAAGGDLKITSGAGTKSITGGLFQFGNASTSAAQTFTCASSASLFNVTINTLNSPIVKLVTNNLTVGGVLTMNGGNIDGASNTLSTVITNNATGAVVRTAGYVNSNLKRAIATTGANYLWPVGFSTNYTPVTYNFTNITAGDLNVLAVTGDEPNLSTSSIDPLKHVKAYWTTTATAGAASTNYSGTYDYASTLNDNAADAPTYVYGKYNGTSWSYPAVSGTPTATSLSFTGASGFSNHAIGKCKTVTTSAPGNTQTICSTTANVTLAANAPGGNETGAWTIVAGSPSTNLSQFSSTSDPLATFTPNGGTGTYTLKWTISITNPAACAGSSANNVIIQVNAAPSATAGGSQTICENGTATVSGASSSNGTIAWTENGAGSITSGATTLTPVYTAAVGDAGTTVTLTMTVSNAPCTPATATYSVVVNANANAGTVNGTTPLCIGATTTYTNTTFNLGGSGTAAWSSSNTGVATVDAAGLVTAVSAGTANITYTITGGCGGTVSTFKALTVSPNATAGTVTAGTSPICIGSTSTFTVSGNSAPGAWSSNNSSIATVNASTGVVTGTGAGTTTIIYTVSTGCNNPVSASQPITVSPNATAGTVTGTTPLCVIGTATYTSNGNAGGTWTSSNTAVATVNASSGLVTAVSPGSANIIYTVSTGCSVPVTASQALTVTGDTWTGATDNNWLTAGNWCGGVPLATTDVVIPASLGNYPIITTGQTALAKNITIASGANVTVNSTGMLSMYGTLTATNSLDASAGTLELAGSSTQTISGSNFKNKFIKNLVIKNNAALSNTANDTLKLTGFLSFGNVNNKTFTTNGILTLTSDLAGTASLKDITNNGVNSGNIIAGNVSVQRYISSGRKWRFVAMNTLGGTGSTDNINANWMEGQAAGTSTGTGYGIWITGTGGTANNFDAATLNGSMKYWDEATQGYAFVTDPLAFNIRSKPAYMTYIRGDRSATGSNALVPETVLRTYGSLTQGSTAPLAINSTNPPGITAVGNPYASAIDLSKLNFTSASNIIITVWDPQGGGGYTLGNFKTLTKTAGGDGNFYMSNGGGSYPAGSNYIMNTIESGQAFYVQGNTQAETVQFVEPAKTPRTNQVFFTSGAEQMINATLSINESGVFTIMDATQCRLRETYNTAVDFNDAIKLTNTSENVSIKRGTSLLAVEYRNVPNTDDTVRLNMTGMRVKNYQWKLDISNMDYPGRTAFLKDQFLGITTPLNLTGITLVDFSVTAAAGSYAPDRFMIIMNQPAVVLPVTLTTISANKQADGSNLVKWQSENEINIAHYEMERSAKGISFATLGNSNPTNNAGGSASYSYADTKPLSGENYYRIKAVGTNGRVQYSAIVKVSSNVKEAAITVNPNPVSGGTMNIAFENQRAGKYTISLVNAAGQKLLTQAVEISSSSEVRQIKTNGAAAGNYRIVITAADGKAETKQIIIE